MRDLKFVRNLQDEAVLRELYDRQEAPEGSAPAVYNGRDGNGNHVLQVLVSREEWTADDSRWHVSISSDGRVPSWDEIAHALHALRPGVPFVLGVPPRSWWMNVNPHVLHAWECKDWNLIEQWRAERRGDTPT